MMSRRDFFGLVTAGAAAATLPKWWLTDKDEGSERRPNLIVIMADDVSAREFGCYGHKKHKTPVLDKLAETGVQFRTCWATPICSPSRAMIMTGRYGFRTGWYHNSLKPGKGEAGYNLAVSYETFAELLKAAGYATAICGKWQLRGTPAEHGFDEYCLWRKYEGFDGPVEKKGMSLPGRAARYWHPAIVKNDKPVPTTEDDYGPDIFADFVLDFARRKKDGAFLVYYPMCLPHVSWDFEANRRGYLPVPELDERGRRSGRKVRGSLKSNVEYIDKLIGRIVRGLEEPGLRENTVIFFTGDNGTAGYGKNQTGMERGPRVPMIVNSPSLLKPQGAVDALTDFSDILPTLCELGGARIPEDYVIDGRSFAGVLTGQEGEEREWIFSCLFDRRFLRDRRWLLDGNGRFYDCGNRRDEKGYKDVTNSKDAQVTAARRRFEQILEKLPPAPMELVEKARREGRRFLPPGRK
jgi:arylsulfatase A-like enzyme